MKTHTSQFKEQIKKFGRQLDSQITYTLNNEEIVLGNENLNAITPHYEGDILKSVMKQLDIDSNVDIPIGTEVNYKFGLKTRSGKNVISLPNNSRTANGLTGNMNGNTITISGTNTKTDNAWVLLSTNYPTLPNFVPGETYTLSIDENTSGAYFQINYYKGETTTQGVLVSQVTSSATFTVPNDFGRVAQVFVGIYKTTTTINTSFKIQLEKGENATEYEEPGEYEYLDYGNYIVYSSEKQEDTKSYKIVAYDKMLYAMKVYERIENKNLFNKDNITNTLFYDVNDGHIINSSLWSQSQFIAIDTTKKYTLQSSYIVLNNSFEVTQFDTNQNWIKGQQASMGTGSFVIGTDITFDSNAKYIRIGFRNDRVDINTIQIEEGETATNYVPYFQYPITLKNYLWNLCDKIGLTLKNTNFVNYDKEITNELYLDSDGNSLNYTYRDVLDEIAGATASTICINEDDELEVRYIKEYKLPSGYSELDYIQSSGTQYIDTGVLAGPNKTIKMKVEPLIVADQTLYGARQENNYSFFYVTQSYSRTAWQYQVGGNWVQTPNNSLETNKVYEIESYLGQTSQSFKYNGDTITSSVNVSNHEYTYNDYLFAGNRYGSVIQYASIKLYNCEVYLNDEKTRHFIPALRNSDNTVGLYDIVNNVFYTNKGTGTFTYGQVVKESVDEIDEEYLKDINVNFGEKYGPINSIVFSRSAESDNIYKKDVDSITENGLNEIKIIDNQILNGNNRDDFIDGVFNQLNGFEYYANDFSSTGVAYYDLCDRYNVRVDNNIYSCIMMNDELDITQGLEEKVHTDIPEKSETDYKKADKTDRRINETWIIANKQEGYIEALTSRTTSLEENTYTITQVNDLIQNAETGITNTFIEAGGNNIFRNTGLWFENSGNDSEQNPYEFWTGKVIRTREENAVNMNALSLQNATLTQQQTVSNGYYTISFKYKRKLLPANASLLINGVEYQLLDSDEVDKEVEFEMIVEVRIQHIEVSFICDVNGGFRIYDLMVNSGQTKLAYSQNQNETTTDTVNISKGITITSSNLDVKFKADADGIRTLDNSNNVKTKFTDVGMETEQAIIRRKSQIVGTLWQEVETQGSNVQTWITKL